MTAGTFPVIDAQVHAYERDHPGRPWVSVLHGPAEVTGDDMVAAMDAAGVDGAILVSPWTMYRYDPSYAVEVHAAHPDRFALVAPIDPRREDVEDAVAAWMAVPGAVGVRLMLWTAPEAGADDRGRQPAVRSSRPPRGAAQRAVLGLAATRRRPGPPPRGHVGRDRPPRPAPALRAAGPRRSVRGAAAAARSRPPGERHGQGERRLHALAPAVPFRRPVGAARPDLRRLRHRPVHVGDGLDAGHGAGFACDAVAAFRDTDRLSDADKAQLMGGTLARVYGWEPTRADRRARMVQNCRQNDVVTRGQARPRGHRMPREQK